MNKGEVLQEAINRYGTEKQLFMLFEEMSELQKEVCKMIRGKDNKEQIAEEMADVEIMLTQLQMICGIDVGTVMAIYDRKVLRLKDRLGLKDGDQVDERNS